MVAGAEGERGRAIEASVSVPDVDNKFKQIDLSAGVPTVFGTDSRRAVAFGYRVMYGFHIQTSA